MAENTGEKEESFLDKAFGKIDSGIAKYADFDPRGVGMKVNGENGTLLMMVEVPTPAWIPDSFFRSMKRNSYFNMINNASFYGKTSIGHANTHESLDFYKESSSGVIGNLINSAIKSVVSTAANQVMSITSKVDSVINGVSSLFGSSGGSKSLFAMIQDTAQNPFIASQPYLKINGIHIANEVRDVWLTIRSTVKTFSKAWDKIVSMFKGETTLESEFEKFCESLKDALKSMGVIPKDVNGDLVSILAKTLSTPEYRMHNFAESQLLSGVSGYYTLTCKLPYFGNRQPIINSSGTAAFKTGWGENGVTPEENSIIGIMRDIGIGATWNKPIGFSPERVGNDAFFPVDYSFCIYNDTLEHVLTNLSFIWTFGATTQAVTDYMNISPPYLYDIEVPGGVRYKFCTCNFSVIPMGKMRKLTTIKQIGASANGDVICGMLKDLCGMDVNPASIEYVPDYYKVNVRFCTLLPNTWNFIDSYLHDKERVPVNGERLMHMLARVVYNFSES